jgi:hypothetical protein
MRRRNDQDISSLDMLLDTMCNTFGGIVFIMLLISVLSASLGRQDAEQARNDTETIEEVDRSVELDRLNREMTALQAAASHLDQVLAAAVAVSNPAALFAATIKSNATLQVQVDALEQTISRIQVAFAEIEKSASTEAINETDLKSQIAQLSQDVKDAKAKDRQPVRLPRLHRIVGKSPAFVIIRDGKFYAISALSMTQESAVDEPFDKEDCSLESGRGKHVFEPRRNAGQLVGSNCERQGKMAQALGCLDPAERFISFSVHTNSFGAFNYVKNVFAQRGFEYNWNVVQGAVEIVVIDDPRYEGL